LGCPSLVSLLLYSSLLYSLLFFIKVRMFNQINTFQNHFSLLFSSLENHLSFSLLVCSNEGCRPCHNFCANHCTLDPSTSSILSWWMNTSNFFNCQSASTSVPMSSSRGWKRLHYHLCFIQTCARGRKYFLLHYMSHRALVAHTFVSIS
jgi:hypothetical protein